MKLIANLTPLDRKAVAELGVPAMGLMEAAGQQVAEAVTRLPGVTAQTAIAILCASGNNGGDGAVCARRLQEAGYDNVQVICTGAWELLTGDAREAFDRLGLTSIPVLWNAQPDETLEQILQGSQIIVDALVGSGLSRPIIGPMARLIEWVNQIRKSRQVTVMAIDLPSGVDAATGRVLGTAIEADYTVTFATPKPGLFLYPGKALAGKVQIADIGLPPVLVENHPSSLRLLSHRQAKALLPYRAPDAYKNTFGHVLVIGGSRRMPGAPSLTAQAALTAGAGLVTLAAPSSVFLRNTLPPEILQWPLPETPDGELSEAALQPLLSRLDQFQAVALGPGLGTAEPTVHLLRTLFKALSQLGMPVVLDADGLNALTLLCRQGAMAMGQLSSQWVLTPHIGEFSRLSGVDKAAVAANLPGAVTHAQQLAPAQWVLKSAVTTVGCDDQTVWLSPLGNNGMATAGSGDVLTGIIAGLAAQSGNARSAALSGVYLHGLAGDSACHFRTAYAVTASSIVSGLPQAFRLLLTQDDGDEFRSY